MGESMRVVVIVIVSILLIDKGEEKKKKQAKRRYPSSKVILYRVTKSNVEGDLTPLTHSCTYTQTYGHYGAYNVTINC